MADNNLPTGWNVVLLDSVAERGSGHTPDKSRPEYWDGNVKWISLQDTHRLDKLWIRDTTARITPLGIKHSSARMHQAGTVVLSRDAGVGKSAIMQSEMAVSQHFIAWHCGPKLSNVFLYYTLQRLKPELERIAMGNTIKTIGLPYFKAFQILYPPLSEQLAIAEALSDADAWIESLEQMVAKKRQIKQGAMQELLTGKRRLPGFSGEWVMKRLGECLQASPGYGINAPGVEFDSRLPTYLRITDITEDGTVTTNNRVSVSHADALNYALARNDIVFARTGASVGKTYLYSEEDGPMVFAGFLICAKVNPQILDPDFLFAFTRTRKYWNWVRMMSMRSGQPGINGVEYASLEIELPPSVTEQSAIAKVLSDQQLAIAELESKLAKARQIKQAMMHELLTGRIRLVEPATTTANMQEAAHA